MLKVQLIVVRGKPEGKSIPIQTPVFRIGRGEDCHLRPNSEEVSRRHAELTVGDSEVLVRDLGSRNGTLVNGKRITGAHLLKSGELLQVGPLTFAVTIQGAAASATPGQPPVAAGAGSLDEVPNDQISAWLVSETGKPTPDRPSGVYDGDTLTIDSYRETLAGKPRSSPAVPTPTPPPAPAPPPEAVAPPEAAAPKAPSPPQPEIEPEPASPFEAALDDIEHLPEGTGDEPAGAASADTDDQHASHEEEAASEVPEEMIDENNPFYAAKKSGTGAGTETAASAKPQFKDSSDAASDILRRMLERRRAGRP